MRSYLIFSFLLFFLSSHVSYAQRVCSTMEVLDRQLKQNPNLKARLDKLEESTKKFSVAYSQKSGNRVVYRIPVVVHVIWNTNPQNITVDQINSQLEVLNEDFRANNRDRANTPALFTPSVADCEIQFYLANNGIIRVQTSKTAFSDNNEVKFRNSGGSNAVSPTTHLNIWVCPLEAGLLGYAQFPGAESTTDGIVIRTTAFGKRGNIAAPFNLGRTATHEIGHWLNLKHIWGDALCGNDNVDDTPVHKSPNMNCPSFPHKNTCIGNNTEMTMNYMDYTDDACMYMFTNGQKMRMLAALTNERAAIIQGQTTTEALGILGLKGGKLMATAVLKDEQSVNGVPFDNINSKVVGKGDFNGDGAQDFIVYTKNGGIKIITYVNGVWQALVDKNAGTWFGGWNFNSTMNWVGGVGDFNGDGKDDIVIRSYWGIGILTWNGAGSLNTIMQQPNGTDFDGWRWWGDHVDSMSMHAVGDFNGDKKADLLVTSSWGVGILTLKGNSMTALMSRPNGTSFGGWIFRLQKNDDSIEGTGDFNGDGKTDIIIRSPWGLGILTYNNAGTLDLLMWQAAGGSLGGWIWNADTRIKAVSDFNGDGRVEMLVTSSWGIGVLTLQGATMKLWVAKPNRTSLGGWIFRIHPNDDIIVGTGDFDGNGKKDVVIRSDWGLGILTLNAAGNSFDGLDFQPNGAVLGSWALKPSDKILVLGNFDRADRQDELLIQR